MTYLFLLVPICVVAGITYYFLKQESLEKRKENERLLQLYDKEFKTTLRQKPLSQIPASYALRLAWQYGVPPNLAHQYLEDTFMRYA